MYFYVYSDNKHRVHFGQMKWLSCFYWLSKYPMWLNLDPSKHPPFKLVISPTGFLFSPQTRLHFVSLCYTVNVCNQSSRSKRRYIPAVPSLMQVGQHLWNNVQSDPQTNTSSIYVMQRSLSSNRTRISLWPVRTFWWIPYLPLHHQVFLSSSLHTRAVVLNLLYPSLPQSLFTCTFNLKEPGSLRS